MPQLVPFYFVNQLVSGFSCILLMVYLLSKYILPRILQLYLTRLFITTL